MLVAIQVARSGTTSPSGANQPDSQTVTSTITRAGMKLSLEVWYTCSSYFIVLLCRCIENKLSRMKLKIKENKYLTQKQSLEKLDSEAFPPRFLVLY